MGTVNNADIAPFNSASTTTAVAIDTYRNIAGLTFDATAAAFTIGTTGGNPLYLTSGGTITILNTFTSANVETINAPLVLEAHIQ